MHVKAIPRMLRLFPAVVRGLQAPHDLELIKALTRAAFPEVKQLSTKRLADWTIEDPGSFITIDVRSAREFAVSHLSGALNLQSSHAIEEQVRHLPSVRLVLYCSVGFRSSRLAQQLSRRNRTRGQECQRYNSAAPIANEIFNLEGSIFQWANEGRPIFQDGVEVTQVHPFSGRCVGLLSPGLAAAETP